MKFLGHSLRYYYSDVSGLGRPNPNGSISPMKFKTYSIATTDHTLWSNIDSMWTEFIEYISPETLHILDLPINKIESLDTPVSILRVSLIDEADGIFSRRMSASTSGYSFLYLGFDVASSGHISSLCHCEYNQEELRRIYSSMNFSLNRYHLLQNLHQAFDFVRVSNRIVPEHAPFFVYSLECAVTGKTKVSG